LQEGCKINMSLSALGNVIEALSNGKKKVENVPYRNSKLTKLLSDSLGGNTKTIMVCVWTPLHGCCDYHMSHITCGAPIRKEILNEYN
jgi:hypothetical protein